ncbi:DNA ligase-1 [Cnuella takakiae]|uniref:DNA ligase (ATP) n=1 Tax=Cnuella takakiae TaxID=1302690 RepID=A0A1M5C5R6_9BACT|nr:ATP-dependent DNA ligase [Cnuella takakiae]OLY93644.1 ATP-dependent DNA ligase [Cnuella takakiae]SHF50051.1 DNA ligase-1 [Cnuella takakiae]
MRSFAELVATLGTTTKTNEKLDALVRYFSVADDRDKVWVIAIFSGRRPRRAVNTTQLATYCVEVTRLPFWMFDECWHTVGDLGETIALLLPENETAQAERPEDERPLYYYIEQLKKIEKEEESVRKQFILESWAEMNRSERFVFNKLITGSFRIGVSQKLMVNALAKATGAEASVIAHRISGNWDPTTISFDELTGEEAHATDISKPYPFYLAYALEDAPASLGLPEEWQVEWKWDGIRGLIIKRQGELFVWSRGEELMTEKFPEYHSLQYILPDGIALDGEIISLPAGPSPALPGGEGAGKNPGGSNSEILNNGVSNSPSTGGGRGEAFRKPLPFSALQTRIGRKNVTKKQLQEAPAGFIVYDLLEYEGADWRTRPLQERRAKLEALLSQWEHPALILSPIVTFTEWEELAALREQSREMASEGFMLKRKSSTYQVGRKRGDWWKWKIDPLTIDAVMIYAQKGAGRRSGLYTDYTFAVRDGDKLVPFTKAYSGLTDKEFAQVDAFVKRNSIEKFGPVRTVKPELVFEIAFEGIAASSRHKSGVALRFPRMLRWRQDKKVEEINTLEDLKQLLEVYGK